MSSSRNEYYIPLIILGQILYTYKHIRLTMQKKKVSIPICTCARCGHKWYLRKPRLPRVCPRCKSPYWRTGSEYKQEIEEDIPRALLLSKQLTEVMENLLRHPERWAKIVEVGWGRMFETSDFPVKRLNPVLEGGFSINDWFLNVYEISSKLAVDLAKRFDETSGKRSDQTSRIPPNIVKVSGWEGVLENLNKEGVKILAFLWYADSLATQLRYPEAEAIIQEKAWELLGNKMGKTKQEIVALIEQMILHVDASNEGATCWAEVIRFP
jgi:hypothetical protein